MNNVLPHYDLILKMRHVRFETHNLIDGNYHVVLIKTDEDKFLVTVL
jgi:hypothetical protein